MIKLLETGIGVFFFVCSLLIFDTYNVINDIILLQYTKGTKISFFPYVL